MEKEIKLVAPRIWSHDRKITLYFLPLNLVKRMNKQVNLDL